ncbi:MAG: hypothetical protein E6593_00950 [Clostridium sp.]|nr:hypothetical protein [Clostridium sp.]
MSRILRRAFSSKPFWTEPAEKHAGRQEHTKEGGKTDKEKGWLFYGTDFQGVTALQTYSNAASKTVE